MAANEDTAARLRMTTADLGRMLGLGRKATLERIKKAGIKALPNCPANKPEYLSSDIMTAFFNGVEIEPLPGKLYSVSDPDTRSLDWAAINEAEEQLAAIRRDQKRAASIEAALAHIQANS